MGVPEVYVIYKQNCLERKKTKNVHRCNILTKSDATVEQIKNKVFSDRSRGSRSIYIISPHGRDIVIDGFRSNGFLEMKK